MQTIIHHKLVQLVPPALPEPFSLTTCTKHYPFCAIYSSPVQGEVDDRAVGRGQPRRANVGIYIFLALLPFVNTFLFVNC